MNYLVLLLSLVSALLAVRARSVPRVRVLDKIKDEDLTTIGCSQLPKGHSCKNVRSYFPDGRDCHLPGDCTFCADGKVEHLMCPEYPLYFPTPIIDPLCSDDSDCAVDEMCCRWSFSKKKVCKKGVDTTPHEGVCPAQIMRGGFAGCLMDYVGCVADSQCESNQKCCLDISCGYNDCMDAESVPEPELGTTDSPTSVHTTDSPTSVHTTDGNIANKTTLLGCSQLPKDHSCSNVRSYFPDGRDSQLTKKCTFCADGKVEHLMCPEYPLYFPTPIVDPLCSNDSECAVDEMCCRWSLGTKVCKKGVDTTPHEGFCPIQDKLDEFGGCAMDYVGCVADSQCKSNQKCCLDINCGYNDCMNASPELEPELGSGYDYIATCFFPELYASYDDTELD